MADEKGPTWSQILVAIIGVVGALGGSWILANNRAEKVARAELVRATADAIAKINAAADSRTAEVAAVYRLQRRVSINIKLGDPYFYPDFSDPEHDPLGTVKTGTRARGGSRRLTPANTRSRPPSD